MPLPRPAAFDLSQWALRMSPLDANAGEEPDTRVATFNLESLDLSSRCGFRWKCAPFALARARSAVVIRDMPRDDVRAAIRRHDRQHARQLFMALRHFMSTHPPALASCYRVGKTLRPLALGQGPS